jgi:Flp pilus assembly pilin Flp
VGFRSSFQALRADRRGLSTVEYILILVIVAITALLLWQTFGDSVGNRVDEATDGVATMDQGGRRGGPGGATTAGTEAAAETTSGRRSSQEGGSSGMGGAMGAAGQEARAGDEPGSSGATAGGASGGSEGPAEGSGPTQADTLVADEGPDLFLWIGWFIVLVLGVVTGFSVLGKRAGKG